jgi:hypothetical protein
MLDCLCHPNKHFGKEFLIFLPKIKAAMAVINLAAVDAGGFHPCGRLKLCQKRFAGIQGTDRFETLVLRRRGKMQQKGFYLQLIRCHFAVFDFQTIFLAFLLFASIHSCPQLFVFGGPIHANKGNIHHGIEIYSAKEKEVT